MMTVFSKMGQKFGVISKKIKFGGRQTSKFLRNFGQFRDLIANISGLEQDIVDRKTALTLTLTLYLLAHFEWLY